MPLATAPALIRTIQSERYWRFFWRRPTKANFSPRSTDSLADLYSFDFVRKYPLARSSIFLRRSRRLVPRFTRGIDAPFEFLFGGWRQESMTRWPLHSLV